MSNIILTTDSYKISHWLQYKPGTSNIYSYFESRGGQFDEVNFFGLQYILKKHLVGKVLTKDKIAEADEILCAHLGPKVFNRSGWESILKKHDGYLPIRIKAVPEGLPIPTLNVLMTVENTDPEFFWLTNFLETILSQVWFPSTVATLSRNIKKMILKNLEQTGTPEDINFKLHDFGFRGTEVFESAAIGGLAHLLNFMGTDTLAALTCGKDYYSSSNLGFSIPAAEHSTITSWGRSNEVDAFENMLDKYPEGLVAVVSDSYNIYEACKIWGTTLKKKVLERKGTLVVRPDSGEPRKVVLKALEILGEHFGFEENSKGYKVLDPHVRVIQGDGVNYNSIHGILHDMEQVGWSGDNIAFGMGGALLQQVNRDTQKFAFKCSSATIDGESVDVYKNPITDPGKMSKKGRFKLVKVPGSHGTVYRTINSDVGFEKDVMEDVFLNGELLKEYTIKDCRENTEKSIAYWS